MHTNSQLDGTSSIARLSFEERWRDLVGNSSLVRSAALGQLCDIPNLWLKSEGINPSGSQKDRVAFEMVSDARKHGYEKITVASCGNYGASLALFANSAGLKAEIVIPESFHTPRIGEMERAGAEVCRYADNYEGCVRYSIAQARARGWYDANPGGANVAGHLRAYSHIADELVTQLGTVPAIVAFPVSNGTTIAGVHEGFQRLRAAGRIDRLPRLVAGSTLNMNPIVESFRAGDWRYRELDPRLIQETEVNEPLINSHSFEGREALAALRQSNGLAAYVTDAELVGAAADLARTCGLRYIPASLAGVVALRRLIREGLEVPPGPVVSILTCACEPIERR